MYKPIDTFIFHKDLEPEAEFESLDRTLPNNWFEGFYQLNYHKAVTLTLRPNDHILYKGQYERVEECSTQVQYNHMRRLIENIRLPKKNFKYIFFFEYTQNGVIHAHGVIESDSKHKIIDWLAKYKRLTHAFVYVKTITNTNIWEEYCQKESEHLPLRRES